MSDERGRAAPRGRLAGSTYAGVDAVLNGTADFLDGTFTGAWTVADDATLTIGGGNNKSSMPAPSPPGAGAG